MEEIKIKTNNRIELIDIADKVNSILEKSKIKSGLCLIFCPHTTAGLTINENADPSVKSDIVDMFKRIIPTNTNYQHAEGNSDSHIKSSIFGSSLSIIIEDSQLQLGTWQGIYFCENDGPRQRQVWVKIISN